MEVVLSRLEGDSGGLILRSLPGDVYSVSPADIQQDLFLLFFFFSFFNSKYTHSDFLGPISSHILEIEVYFTYK